MDIKWSYVFITIIYILVILLRVINSIKTTQFKKEHAGVIEVLSIKKDFFMTVSLCCTISVLLINGAALWGGKPINKASIIITVLVLGFTGINSVSSVLLSLEEQTLFLLGYGVELSEVEKYKVKSKRGRMLYDITFTKEIDSYNYVKLIALGKNREKLQSILQGIDPH